MEYLSYTKTSKYYPEYPIPGIPTVTAEHFLSAGVSPRVDEELDVIIVEGVMFDRNGNLYFVDGDERVRKVDMDTKKESVIYWDQEKNDPVICQIGAVKIHKDGRIFYAGLGKGRARGSVYATAPDGTNLEMIMDGDYSVDDIVFDSNGGFYFTDFRGDITNPIGGVYYVSPAYKTVTPILKNLALPNGVALSPDGKILWVTESLENRLIRAELEDATTIARYGVSVPYRFTGYWGPDSCSVDADGNLYVAVFGCGYVAVFNERGVPIGQILIPGREDGKNLLTSHAMVRPGTRELYITTSCKEDKSSTIFVAGAFAEANMNAYQYL